MTKEQVISAIERNFIGEGGGLDPDQCTQVVDALVELGVIHDVGTGCEFIVNKTILADYPECVHDWVDQLVNQSRNAS